MPKNDKSSIKPMRVAPPAMAPEARRRLAEIVSACKASRIPSFILLFQETPDVTTFHVESVPVKHALDMLITGFQQTIKLELAQHPEYGPRYSNILKNLLADFGAIIRKANAGIASLGGPDEALKK